MRYVIGLILLAACSGSGTTPPKIDSTIVESKAVDPAMAIHVLDQLDTTTAAGRASWSIFPLLYSSDPQKSGVGYSGTLTLTDVRLKHAGNCIIYQADSLGARQVIVLAVADTQHGTQTDASAQTVASQWYAGNHVLPSGWMALASDSVDWGASAQFDAGHGRTMNDPVRWDLTWTSPHSATRSEAPLDDTCH